MSDGLGRTRVDKKSEEAEDKTKARQKETKLF
jgi:hypothetical protein